MSGEEEEGRGRVCNDREFQRKKPGDLEEGRKTGRVVGDGNHNTV